MKTLKIKSNDRIIPANIMVPEGDGPFAAVVMNHGHGGSKEEHGGFVKIAEALAERGILTIAMDFPGCGDSTEPFTENYISNMVSDSNASLEYILDNYNIDKDKLGILGYSMGGAVSLEVVGQPDSPYKAVGLLAPLANQVQDVIMNFVGGKDVFVKLIEQAKSEKGYIELENEHGQDRSLSEKWLDDIKEFNPLKIIENLDKEMLIIYGGEDEIIKQPIIEDILSSDPDIKDVFIKRADHTFGFHEEESSITKKVAESFADYFEENLK